MSNVSEVLLEAALLEPDVQTRIVCPFCQGGSTEERCMSIVRTADGTVKYICHRSNCGIAGRNNTPSTDPVAGHGRPPRQTREMSLVALDHMQIAEVCARWQITPAAVNAAQWRWDALSERLAFPVMGHDGKLRGMVLRTLKTGVKPKTLNVQFEPDEPFLAWYAGVLNEFTRKLLIVEDIPSAVKASRCGLLTDVVALNGTHISHEALLEIRKIANGPNIILALDEDASKLALEYAAKFALHLGRIKVLLLTQDLKDMPNEEIQSCLLNVL